MILRSILSYVYCEYHECNCKRREGDLKTFPIVRKLKSIEKPEKSILTRQKHFKEKQFHRLDRMLKSKTQEKRNQRWKTGGNEKSVFWLRWQFHGKYKSFAGSAVGLWFDFNKSERGELRVRLLRDEALAVWGKNEHEIAASFRRETFPQVGYLFEVRARDTTRLLGLATRPGNREVDETLDYSSAIRTSIFSYDYVNISVLFQTQ